MTNGPANQIPVTQWAQPPHEDARWLDAEIAAAIGESQRALLLYELGHLTELGGSATDSARLYLQSVNTDARFAEPVERLLALFEQRHSMKNIGRVVERLQLLATSPEQQERSATEHAAFALIEQQDRLTACELLRQLVASSGASATAWNLLQCIAEQSGDMELLQQALRARTTVASSDPVWSGILLLELAETQRKVGLFEDALESLDRIIDAAGPRTFAAFDMVQRLAMQAGHFEALARSYLGQASLLDRAMRDTTEGDSLGVPRWRRSQQHIAESFLRAALARHAAGNASESATLLEKARDLSPNDPLIEHVTQLCAEELGDFDLAIAQARAVAARATGDSAAVAWLRVALFQLSRNDIGGVIQAVTSALECAPNSIPLRALELYALARDAQPAKFAAALETCANLVTSDAAKSRYFFAAANVWACRCNDATLTRAALAQAGLFGGSPSVGHRMARLLALQLRDDDWYDEATCRLATSAAEPDEQCEQWLELFRFHLVSGQSGKALSDLAGLAATESGRSLSVLLEALWEPSNQTGPSGEQSVGEPSAAPGLREGPSADGSQASPGAERPLKRYAELCTDEPLRTAFMLADARRALLRNGYENALEILEELIQQNPSNVAAALSVINLRTQRGTRSATIDALCNAANTIENHTLAATLGIKAALLSVYENDSSRFLSGMDCVRARAPELAPSLEGWLSRSPIPGLDARNALGSSPPPTGVSQRWALEAFAREMKNQNLATAGAALDQATIDGSSLGIAVALARLLLDTSVTPDAIEQISDLAEPFQPISGALRVRYALINAGMASPEHLTAARRWSEVDTGIAPAIELLVASRSQGKLDAERVAWSLLEQRAPERAKSQLQLARTRFKLMGDSMLPPLVSEQSPQARLLNLEASRPGCDPRRRRQSLQQASTLFDGTDRRVSSVLAAFNALAAGAVKEALAEFKEVVARDPGSVSAWEGLRLAAEITGDLASVAHACEALGKCMGDGAAAAEFYEQAAVLYLGELKDETRGEQLLSLAVTSDISRFSAFDRLFRRVRDRNDGTRLLELIDLRLNVSEDVDELVKLHWERARVLRGMGERDAALQALENVTLLEPNHVGALALAAEIAISSHQLADACKYLDQLARLAVAPEKQRLMSAIAAADLYESKLGQPERAVSLLLALTDAGFDALALRERLARCAAQAENWQLAAEVTLGLAEDRDTSAGRVEAARLSMSIYREKMLAPAAALPAVEHILAELPADLEVIDFLLEQPFADVQNGMLCRRARDALGEQIRAEPFDPESIDRLAQLAALLDDRPLRQVALGALVTLDAGSPEMLDELASLDARVARTPSIALDAQCYSVLADPEDCGPVAELFRQLAPLFNETLGPNLLALGVTRKNRLDPRAGHPLRNEIAAWAGALGLGEFDLYVGGVAAEDDVIGVPSETPALVVGTNLRSPLAAEHRQAVARELFAIRQGTSILRHRTPAEAAALTVAVCRLAEVHVSAPPYAMVDEFVRLLNASIPRKTRKLLPSLCAPLGGTELDTARWFAAAIASRDRMATIAGGDLSLVLGREAQPATADNTLSVVDRRRRVMPFLFSPDYLSLRSRLGVQVR